MSPDQVLLGLGLTLVLAVGSQVVASRLRIPALIVLLPVGFVAGALTDDVNPYRLLGPAFQPLVSLSVAVILYDAALGLDLARFTGPTRRVVVRLLAFGVPITWAFTALFAMPIHGMAVGAALMFGAILVVSGPTVVGPLLDFVGPRERPRRILAWEGSLIDPVGGVLGALVFHAVVSTGTRDELAAEAGHFLASVAVGAAGSAVGIGVLWLLLCKLGLDEVLGTSAQLATVVGVAAVCDIVRDDTGLITAIVMGLAVSNLPGFDISARRPFFETLVQLILGLLFVSISATVAPDSLWPVVLPTLGLVAVLVLVTRPLVAHIATHGTDLDAGERRFIGWMDPRGIVAAATASTYSAGLVGAGIGGAEKVLPATFLVIVFTVTLYGLTAAPVARRLGVTRPARTRPLLVGGDPWAIDLGRALRATGLDVLMWVGPEHQRENIRRAGLELAPGELIADATGRGAQIEGVTTLLLLTPEDDFNALAATVLAESQGGPVYRLAPPPDSHGVVAPYTGGEILFRAGLTGSALAQRYRDGAEIVAHPAGDGAPDGHDVLFVVRANGRLAPVTRAGPPAPEPGDTHVLLGPAATPTAHRSWRPDPVETEGD